MYKLAVLVGSLKKDSVNKKLASGLAELGKDIFSFDFLNLENVPMFCEDLEQNLPAPVVAMKNTVAEADGLLIVTPEYNRSYPALVKNTLDWCSRPSGKGVLGGKPLAIAGMSPGAVGTAACQSHLRSIAAFLGMKHMGQPEIYLQHKPDFFDANGRI
ncbi:NAD(P)H-dependent oxidoreductase, partial [Desulfovibrio sp. OttesenSCG-928-C06]|nr:NAD(P)H-dependent oxidoreductase [Desulfovibrio sp. OttesenSCG-928-C06]